MSYSFNSSISSSIIPSPVAHDVELSMPAPSLWNFFRINLLSLFESFTRRNSFLPGFFLCSKLILIGGLNKIAGKGLDLKTALTIPSVLERYDSKVTDVDVFGWENMWDFYKDKVKGNQSIGVLL